VLPDPKPVKKPVEVTEKVPFGSYLPEQGDPVNMPIMQRETALESIGIVTTNGNGKH
jgi:hypothetical protein